MDVEWNEARMDEGVTDGHSHNSFRSDTHEEIREVEIEYSWRNYGNNGAASILRFREVQKILDELLRQRLIAPVIYDMVLRKYQRICSQHVV